MNGNKMKKFKLPAIAALVVAALFLPLVFVNSTSDTITATVTGKERITTGSGENMSHKYLVFTEGETFQNTDSLYCMKFNSSDVHGSIKEGESYTFDVYGWRVPFLSMYRNIVSARAQ